MTYNLHIMAMLKFISSCKVRQCSECQEDTEFYCNTCKYDLCVQCKERHVIDLDTIYHDVVIYREKYENILKQETCVKHQDRIYEKYCHSCEIPVCVQCNVHRKNKILRFCFQYTNHTKHKILDIRTAYKTGRQQHRRIIHGIRSETLFNSCFLLTGIKTNMKTCHTEISNRHSDTSTNAQRLRDLIDNVMCEIKNSFIHTLQKQMIKMNRYVANIEYCEHRSERSGNRPVEFLSFFKKTLAPKIHHSLNLTQHTLVPLTEEINRQDLIKLLTDTHIRESGKRQVKKENLLKVMTSPVLQRSVTVTGVNRVIHISCLNSDQFWISDRHNNLILTNSSGDTLHYLTDISSYMWSYAAHTVNISGDLIYIDRDFNIKIIHTDNRTKFTLIKKAGPWMPVCVYCSTSNGDLLIGMHKTDTYTARINRYDNTGQYIHAIKCTGAGQELYRRPRYITENSNGDVIVSDLDRVVVTEYEGSHRFSYTGPPACTGLAPHGICTDVLSHILVCDDNTETIQMIDKDGHFLSLIPIDQQEIERPRVLGYDDRTHLLWIGSWDSNKFCAYRYIQRQDHLTRNYNQYI
ncbi:uncharacterized protein LOC133180663 [Saccostrea echinata]|uniref:uncharacterized protein LOC133180663 n=1 Tax=Saccostrea echinata TaxID=191078 RepID=UPI002A7FA8C0|nr:uncharacterized protein LOC133180663 [Saccostrea echinata]